MRKTARPVVWEGDGARSPSLHPILIPNNAPGSRMSSGSPVYGIWGLALARIFAIQSAWGRPQLERAWISRSTSYRPIQQEIGSAVIAVVGKAIRLWFG